MAKKKTKAKEPKKENTSKEIVIKETEDDVVFGNGFTGDPQEFKDEIKKEAEKSAVFMRFVMPVLVFVVIGIITGLATWYYAKPENANPSTQQKIQTPPTVNEEEPQKTEEKTPAVTPTPKPTQAPTPTVQTYKVKEGDTLSGIANQYGLTSQQLAKYNGLTDADTLHIGQVLKIPVK